MAGQALRSAMTRRLAAILSADRGRLVDEPGDNLLAEFTSVMNAAELAESDTRTILATRRIEGCADDVFGLHDRIAAEAAATIAPYVREAEIRRTLRPAVCLPVGTLATVNGGAG